MYISYLNTTKPVLWLSQYYKQIIFYSLIGMKCKVRGHNSLWQHWWHVCKTLKGWSSIPVRSYKGMSTPIAMILCLSHSNVLKYTVLTTYPCYNKHIFRLHSHFITWNLFFIMQLLTSENLSSPEGKNWADQLPSFTSLYTSKHK